MTVSKRRVIIHRLKGWERRILVVSKCNVILNTLTFTLYWRLIPLPSHPKKKPCDSWKIFRNSEKKKASARQSFLMFYWLSIFVDGACRLVEEDHSKYDEKSHDESSVKKMSSAKIRNSSFEAEKGKNSLKISCYSFHLVCSISVISVTWWEKNYTLITRRLFENFENPEKELRFSFFLYCL